MLCVTRRLLLLIYAPLIKKACTLTLTKWLFQAVEGGIVCVIYQWALLYSCSHLLLSTNTTATHLRFAHMQPYS